MCWHFIPALHTVGWSVTSFTYTTANSSEVIVYLVCLVCGMWCVCTRGIIASTCLAVIHSLLYLSVTRSMLLILMLLPSPSIVYCTTISMVKEQDNCVFVLFFFLLHNWSLVMVVLCCWHALVRFMALNWFAASQKIRQKMSCIARKMIWAQFPSI